MQVYFENFKELRAKMPAVAKELVHYVGKGDWMNGDIYYYYSLESYAEHELTDGWYIDKHFADNDYKGAPDPLDYIDMEQFSKALVANWDESCHYLTSRGQVLESSWGW